MASPSKMDDKAYDDTVPIAVQAQESKRRKRRIMKIAVYFMFGVITMGVFAIWLFHKDSVESLRFGSEFIITVKLRSLEIKDSEGDGVLYGEMGRNLMATPYDHCWDEKYVNYETNCIYWRNRARLRVDKNDNGSSVCYTLRWEVIDPEYSVDDCFYLQDYQWFGYLTNTTNPWPISGISLTQFDYYEKYPQEPTENLAPAWFGSQGVSLFVDSSFPFQASINVSDKRQICLMSTLKQTTSEPRELLKYTVCQSSSLKDVYSASQRHRQMVYSDFDYDRTHKNMMLPKPIHVISTKDKLLELQKQLQKNESQCSLIELYSDWEAQFGDLVVDPTMINKVDKLIRVAVSQDCYPILPLSTFFSVNSRHFTEGIKNKYFVKDHRNLVTKMIQWRGHEGAVLDVSNPDAAQWFLDFVRKTIKQLRVRAVKLFYLNLPPEATYFDSNLTYLDYTRIFARELTPLNISLVLERASGFIPVPVYTPLQMSFHEEPGKAPCMNTSIPYSLSLGMSGYSLLIADADRLAYDSDNPMAKEMFMRWIQLAIFYPVLKIPSIPLLEDTEVQKFLREALRLRETQLLPYLTQVWEDQPDLPIIRPLAWLAAQDPKALVINDQFMVGDRLMVAPALCVGMKERDVYLPYGNWTNRGDNQKSVHIGPQTLKIYTNMSIIPFFWYEEEKENNS